MNFQPFRSFGGMGGGMSVPAFSPLSIPGCILWLDAADSATLFDATTGGSTPADGGNVKRWQDKSGGNYHATEATVCPLRQTAVQNGRDVVEFDGFTKKLIGSWVSFSALTVFAVFKVTGGNSYGRVFSQRGPGSSLDYDQTGHYIPLIRNLAASEIGVYAGSGIRQSSAGMWNAWCVAASKHTGAALRNYLNGSAVAAAYTHTLGSAGAEYHMGAATGAGVVCQYGEIIAYNSALDDTNRASVEAYAAAKWGIIIS